MASARPENTTLTPNTHSMADATGKVRTWNLPRADDALYYTAVPAGADGSVCATRCGDVEVVCTAPARKR